jgi:hypothetical protein
MSSALHSTQLRQAVSQTGVCPSQTRPQGDVMVGMVGTPASRSGVGSVLLLPPVVPVEDLPPLPVPPCAVLPPCAAPPALRPALAVPLPTLAPAALVPARAAALLPAPLATDGPLIPAAVLA